MQFYKRLQCFRSFPVLLALLAAVSVSRATQGEDKKEPGLTGVWSPDHKTLAGVESQQSLATPAGANFCLYFNSQPVYPNDCRPWPKATYVHIHAFLSPPEWSSDGRRVAFVEKIFDWEYTDFFGAYWDGTSSDVHYYLVIAATDRTVSGYALKEVSEQPSLKWKDDSQLVLNGQTYDLAANPPAPIPAK
jgi:hypothetical protein